jgi:2-polyprenyl-6-hydroxyphenyl methylase/3-demethylubiquinone-9 3-methyltransferase
MASRRSTIDKEEAGRFAALAQNWWDEDGAMAPLHRMNPVRLAFLRDRLCDHFGRDGMKPFAGLSIIDVGCGAGLVCEPLARLGATVTGIDATEDMVRAARTHAKAMRLDIDYRVAAAEDLTEKFDAVVALEVIEHVADRELFLQSICARVAPGGAMVLSTINRTPKAFAMAIVGAEYVMRWLPRGTHDWAKFVKPSELARGLAAQGFRIAALDGMVYDPIGRDWRLGKDLAVNYLAFAVRGA